MTISIRWNDYALADEQSDLRAVLQQFFSDHSPAERVRAAEPLGFDRALWEQVVQVGISKLALPEEVGGQGAGLAELALAAEEVGRTCV